MATYADGKFCYEHPDIVRDRLRQSPCKKCKYQESCGMPCRSYLEWYDLRMKYIRDNHGI